MGFVTAFSQEAKLGATAESPLAKTKRERAALAVSNVYRDFSRCPRCGAPTMKARAYNSSESEFWVECTQCNTFINTYIPQVHQAEFHRDAHRYTANFGGYGSGKTTTSREEFYKHLFLTPNGNFLIGANVASQYEQTIKRDIEGDLPGAFFAGYSSQKQYYDFINGFRLMFRPLDDVDKLRSYNLTGFLILEGSEVKDTAFTQLKTRLRNMAATLPEVGEDGKIVYLKTKTGQLIPKIRRNWGKGIIESNPDNGWIKSEVLLHSSEIYLHGGLKDVYDIPEDEKNPTMSSHVTPTSANEFLPETFWAEQVANKPAWWVARYLNGSFLYTEGLVYPAAANCVVEPFEIPKHWKRIVAHDYGLNDDSVFLFGAVDETNNLLYIYKELRTNQKNVETLAALYHTGVADIPSGGMICPPIIDPKSGPRRDYDLKTLADHYLDYGIAFMPGAVNVDARIFRLNTYFESGKVKIFNTCKDLIEELKNYKFVAKTGTMSGWTDKPEDKNNHGVNALEWITMELPANPKDLVYGIYNRKGKDITLGSKVIDPRSDEERYADWVLQDSDPGVYDDYSGPFGLDYE